MGDGDDGVVVIVVGERGRKKARERGGEREKAGILVVRRRWGLRPVFAQARGAESDFTTLLQEDIHTILSALYSTRRLH